MKNKILLFLKFSLLFVVIFPILLSCNKNKDRYNDQLLTIYKYVKEDVELKYEMYKSIKGCDTYFRGDSIYILGNSIVNQIENNTKPNEKSVKYFYNEAKYEMSNIQTNLSFDKENLNKNKVIEQLKIRILQSAYLNQVLLDNMRSNFQVNLIGVSPVNKTCKHGTLNNIDLHLRYFSSSFKDPVVIIGKDTLKGDGFNYKYKYSPKNIGYDTINARIITERWGEMRDFDCFFVLKIDK